MPSPRTIVVFDPMKSDGADDTLGDADGLIVGGFEGMADTDGAEDGLADGDALKLGCEEG